MKKISTFLLIVLLCMSFTSCRTAALSGDPVVYYNSNKSFSIELPASSEKTWVISEEAGGDILYMTDRRGDVTIQVQCLSKLQAEPIAENLAEYQVHVIARTFASPLANAKMTETRVKVPSFIINSYANTYTAGKDTQGLIVFMESASCYYAYLVRTSADAYDANKQVFRDSIASLKELTETP